MTAVHQQNAPNAAGPSVIIIGGGIAGLSAGVYARMNDFNATILEMHDLPGGLCTAWKRNGYTFDGCIDWLVGSSPTSGFHRIWEELGATKDRRFIAHEEYFRYEGRDGKTLILYTDPDRLEKHLLDLAPEDERPIKELASGIRKLGRMEMPIENPGLVKGIQMAPGILPVMGVMRRYGRMTTAALAASFKNSFLREAFGAIAGMRDLPVLGLMMPMAFMSSGDAGYPLGGSLPFARAIEQRYLDLGGEIRYKSRVSKILVDGNEQTGFRAVGVRLADGSEYRADYVISAADGHATIFDMLEGKFASDQLRELYELKGDLEPFPAMIQVSLGVNRDFAGQPKSIRFQLAAPIEIAGLRQETMGFKHYSYDPAMAPAGKSALTVIFMSDYDYWLPLAADRAKYEAEKEQIAALVIGVLDQRLPGIREQIEAVDVATPLTFERYTGNWRASFEGWLPGIQSVSRVLNPGIPKTLPGLDRFHMIGQWTVVGGGLPPAGKDGRDVIKKLCRLEGREFTTTTP